MMSPRPAAASPPAAVISAARTASRRSGGHHSRRARLTAAAHEDRPTEEAGCMSDTREQAGSGGDGVPHITARKTGMLEEIDVSGREDVAKLRRGAVGIWGVLFLTVTGSAPISAML